MLATGRIRIIGKACNTCSEGKHELDRKPEGLDPSISGIKHCPKHRKYSLIHMFHIYFTSVFQITH